MDRAVLETASDRYVIVEYLAEGGMGAIYLGKKLGVDGFEKDVVLKQLLPEFTREQKFIDLFLREARLSASLDHANIVRTVDLVNAGDDYFMVMEYVRGGDLRTLLRRARRRHKRFSPQAAVFIGHEILEALAYAHAKTTPDGRMLNLIHRDVSPSNILLSGAGEVKLTDFGIAKASTHRSVFYKVKGKVGYMSPEQARGENVDRRADLFSLAVVLWEVLTGERLFVGDLLSTASMVYSQKVRPPSQKRPDVPPEIDAVLMKSLSLDPAQRYQSAEEMQEALSRAAQRTRLLAGAGEMASHLREVCGEDPSTWLKLETLSSFDESQAIHTHAAGTAVLSSAEDASPDPFDDSEPHPARPQPAAALEHKELTSVIALRGDDIELISESEAMPLTPLQPQRRSEPVRAPRQPTPTVPFDREDREQASLAFDNESSHAATRVRTSASGNIDIEDASGARPPQRYKPSPSGLQTLVRDGSGPSAARASQETSPSTELPRTRKQRPTSTGMIRPPDENPARGQPQRTEAVRRVAANPGRVLLLIAFLLLVGIGVAAAVAFSGPSLDMPEDPTASPAPAPASPAAPESAGAQTQTPR